MLRVRALGCFFEVPASYTLIADPGERLSFIAPLARGSITIEPYSLETVRGLREVSSANTGHLTVAEFTDQDEKEPALATVVHNGLQVVLFTGSAREFVNAVTRSCLANLHPKAPGAP